MKHPADNLPALINADFVDCMIARSDMLILEPEGKDAENIKLGSTLSVCRGLLAKNKHDGSVVVNKPTLAA